MNNDITQLLIIAYAIVPFVNAVVGLIRKSFPSLRSNLIPLISFGTGILLGLLFSLLPSASYSLLQMVMAGGIAGMAASGVYEIAKFPSSTNTQNKE